jgi:hypothetical protein
VGRKLTIDLRGGELTFTSAREALAVASLEKAPQKNYPREAVRGAPPGAGVEIGERRQYVLGSYNSKDCATDHSAERSFRLNNLWTTPPVFTQWAIQNEIPVGEFVFNNETELGSCLAPGAVIAGPGFC